MAINTSSVVSNVYAQSYSASSKSTTKTTKQDETTEVKKEEIKEESSWSGFTKSLGKWLGIGMVVVLFGLMIWKGIKDKLLL